MFALMDADALRSLAPILMVGAFFPHDVLEVTRGES